jgi:hypothetical protein
MMQPTPTQRDILRATAAFAAVARYQGTMPKRQALVYAKDDLAILEDAGFLEQVKLSYPCGKSVAGWRLTNAGRRLLPGQEHIGEEELEPEHLRILSDVYHYSRISRFGGMMPKELGKDYDADDMRDLYWHGYLLRIRLKGAKRAKGWVVSAKGLAVLHLAFGTTPSRYGVPRPEAGPTAQRADAV